MIRPKISTIEGQGTAGKRNSGEIFDFREFLSGIQPRNVPILIPLLRPAQDVDRAIDKDMATYLGVEGISRRICHSHRA